MSHLSFMEKLLEGVEVEWKILGDHAEIYDGTHQTPKYTSSGVPFVSVQNINDLYSTKKYISIEDFEKYKYKPRKNDLFMTRIGDIGTCAIVENDNPLAYYVTLTLIRVNQEIVLPKFLKHVIESGIGKAELYKRTLVHATPIKINLGEIGKINIPIPCPRNPEKSLAIQAEIVRILDAFTELTAELTVELTAELTARKKQYNYYHDQLLTFEEGEVEWKALGQVAIIGTGSRNTNEAVLGGQYPFFVRSQASRTIDDFEFDETAIITAGDGVGVGKVFHYISGKYALHQRAYRIVVTDNNVKSKFLFHFIRNNFARYLTTTSVHASVTSLRKPMFEKYPIPIPSPEEQERIVAILDRFDTLTDSITEGLPREIELRQQQYEYYREQLLSFPKVDGEA